MRRGATLVVEPSTAGRRRIAAAAHRRRPWAASVHRRPFAVVVSCPLSPPRGLKRPGSHVTTTATAGRSRRRRT